MNIDIVIIGLNAEKTLLRCIESVLQQNYDTQKLNIFYVDTGSTDRSVSIAGQFPEVKVIQLHPLFPTPGLGRNYGWRAGNSHLVQFLDSDTCLDKNFLSIAALEISKPNVAAVKGLRKEMYPKKSIYNWIGDLEWNENAGEAMMFGGDVLIRREVLDKVKGYNDKLIAAEDSELSSRIRKLGWKIIQLDTLMCTHDLSLTSFQAYFWRSYRTGYGYAEVYNLKSNLNGLWKKEVVRLILRGGGFFICLIGSVFSYGITIIPAFFILLYPRIFKIKDIQENKHLTAKEAKIYAWHCSFVILPQFLGLVRYYLGAILKIPLGNKSLRSHLIT